MSREQRENIIKKRRNILLNIVIGIIFIFIICYIEGVISLAIAQNYIVNDGKAVMNTYFIAKKMGEYNYKSGKLPKTNELKSIIQELKLEKKVIVISDETLKVKCGKSIKGNIIKKWINVYIDKKEMSIKFEEGCINSEGKNWSDKGPISIPSDDKPKN